MRIVDLPVISQVASLFTWVEGLCAALLAKIKRVANRILFDPAPANAPMPMQGREVVPENRVANEAAENIRNMQGVLGRHLAKKREDNAFLYGLNQRLKDLLPSQDSQITCRRWNREALEFRTFTILGLIHALPVEPPFESQNAANHPLQTQVHAEAAQCRDTLNIYEALQSVPNLGGLREEIQKLPTDNEALRALMEA